jgi:hypothetical protein
VPEEVRALRPSSGEAGTEDDVGDAALDRLDQRRHVGGVVFEIGVLDHRDVAVRVRDRRAHRRALAAVVLADDDDAVTSIAPALDEFARAVRRAVVDDDDLLVEVECPHGVEQRLDRRRLVVGRHEEGHAHGGAA